MQTDADNTSRFVEDVAHVQGQNAVRTVADLANGLAVYDIVFYGGGVRSVFFCPQAVFVIAVVGGPVIGEWSRSESGACEAFPHR